jgi:hypothetical protein
MIKNVDLNTIPVVNVNGTEMYLLAKNELKLEFNKLSPFFTQPNESREISSQMLEISKDKDFLRAIKVIASPKIRINCRKGGAAFVVEQFTTLISKVEGALCIVTLMESDINMNIFLFKSIEEYATFFASQNAQLVSRETINLLENSTTIENIVCIFNLTDCFRRAYLNGMLEDSTEPVKAILEADFVSVLERELKSGDIRWLVPSFIRLVPGLSEVKLNFEDGQMKELERLGFLTSVEEVEEKGIRILNFGGSGRYMGLEFTHFWKASVGFDIVSFDREKNGVSSTNKYYFAPTEEGNHLFKIEDGNNGKKMVSHTVHTFESFINEMTQIVSDAMGK